MILNDLVHGERKGGRTVKKWSDGIRNDVKLLNITSKDEASRMAQMREI